MKQRYYLIKNVFYGGVFIVSLQNMAFSAGSFTVDMADWKSNVKIKGRIDGNEGSIYSFGGNSRAGSIIFNFDSGIVGDPIDQINYTPASGLYCPDGFPDPRIGPNALTETQVVQFINLINNQYANYYNSWSKGNLTPPSYASELRVSSFWIGCRVRGSLNDSWGWKISITANLVNVVNPPPKPRICNFNNPQIEMQFSASDLSVDGLTQNSRLNITCSDGGYADYTLKLTSTTVSNGRLSFGNGVSAIIRIANNELEANGASLGVNFSGTTQNLPISAELVGTASEAGESSANGILILELK